MHEGDAELAALREPPSGTRPRPAVRTLLQELPFGELSWEDFEKLCERLAEAEGDPQYVSRYGTPGQDEDGIDIFSRDSGGDGYVVYQCKRYTRLFPSTIRNAVDEFLDGEWSATSQRFVLCTSHGLRDASLARELETQAARLRAHEPPVVFDAWGCEKLSRKLKSRADLVLDFFGPPFVDLFLPKDHAPGANAQLPAPPSDFVARGGEIERVVDWIAASSAHRVVVLTGMPGVGKTALALAIARRLRRDLSEGEVFVDLRGTTAPVTSDDIASEVLRSLIGTERVPSTAPDRLGAVSELLQTRRGIVVLDDAASSAQVASLARVATACSLIVTSRTMLATIPGSFRLQLETLSDEDGIRLLARLAGEERVSAQLDASLRLVHLCGGLPLALRITGARLATRPNWTLAAYSEQLTDERLRLSRLSLEDLDVRASFSLSYASLSDMERRTFRAAGAAFVGELNVDDVSALLGAPAELALERLADAQLLTAPEVARYGIHELLRLFANERWIDEVPPDDRLTALEQLAVYLLREGRAAASAPSLGWLSTRRATIQKVAAALEPTRPQLVSALALEVGPLYPALRTIRDWLPLIELGLRAAKRSGNVIAERNLELNQLIATAELGDTSSCTPRFREIADAAAQRGDTAIEARALAQLARHYKHGDIDEAVNLLTRALERYRDDGDVQGEARALGDLGNAYELLERYPQASETHRQAVAQFEAADDPFGAALEWMNLSWTLQLEERMADGNIAAQTALRKFRELGADYYAASAGMRAGEILWKLGDPDAAEQLIDDASQAFQRAGALKERVELHRRRARLRYESGLFEAAMKELDVASELADKLGDPLERADLESARGVVAEGADDLERSVAHFRRSVSMFEQLGMGPHVGHGRALVGLAEERLLRGALTEARAYLRRAAQTFEDAGDSSSAAGALGQLLQNLIEIARDDEARQVLQRTLLLDPASRDALDEFVSTPRATVQVSGDGIGPDDHDRVRMWLRRAAGRLLPVRDFLLVEIETDASRPYSTATNQNRILINASLLEDPGVRNELHLGWRMHTALAEHIMWSHGIPSDGALGTFLVSMAAEGFAALCFASDDNEAPFGPAPPNDEHDVVGIGETLGAALAGGVAARDRLEAFLSRIETATAASGSASAFLQTPELAWRTPNEPINTALNLWYSRGGVSL